jgi:hypothetical protein
VRLAFAAVVALLAAPFTAGAETRIFIIENQHDGYGVDRCLASGDTCGQPVASAYCQSRQFVTATSFRKLDRDEITGGAEPASCHGANCTDYIAIACTR